MNDTSLLSNLDKLLLELVFQSEQDAYAKEHTKEQIQIFTAHALERKHQICVLSENISKSDDDLFHLQRHCTYSKSNCSAWKPTCLVFKKHEDYLQGKLQSCQESTEKDNKMYQQYINQFQENLKQRHSHYRDTALAQDYYTKKAELDDLQNKLLTFKEQFTRKEAAQKELLEPPSFKSYVDWALKIVSLKHSTADILKRASNLRHTTSNLEKEVEQLQMKSTHFKQYGQGSQEQNVSEIIEGDNPIKGMDYGNSLFEDKDSSQLPNEKNLSQNLLLSWTPSKSVRPLKGFTFSLQLSETGRDVKENAIEQSTGSSIPSNQIPAKPSGIEKRPDTAENKRPEHAQVPTIAHLQSHMQFRLSMPQKQTNKWVDHRTSETRITETENNKSAGDSKDSAYASQDVLTESFKSTGNITGREEGRGGDFSRAPEPLLFSKSPLFPRTPDTPVFPETPEDNECHQNRGMPVLMKTPELARSRGQLPKTPTFEMNQNFGCDVSTEKSPSFSFLMTSTPKTSRFNLFESSLFGTPNSPEQNNECFPNSNINPTTSDQKDIGDIFGKMDREDEFAFSFPSESSHAFGDAKDDFSFPFSFGQDQKSPHVSSPKGFQSSSERAMQFTFF
ncbi:protein SIX6OS1 [Lissotriton helveticus]